MAEFSESLEALWGVQKHDHAITSSQETINKATRDNDAAQVKVGNAETKLASAQANLRKLQHEHRELESELQRLDTRVKQLEAQGTEVGMTASAKQRVKIDELEMQGLDLLTAIATAESDVQAAKSELAAQQTVRDGVFKANAAVIAAAQAVIDAELAARALAADKVVPELLHVYEEVNARFPGNALCRVEGEYCSKCQSELRPQLVMQIKTRAEIIRCPNCLRIIDV